MSVANLFGESPSLPVDSTVNGMTINGSPPAIVFQPGGSGNTYTLEAAANPATDTVIDLSTLVNIEHSLVPIITPSANITLTAAQTGSDVLVQALVSAYTITLPATSNGLNFHFLVLPAPSYTVTITAPASASIYAITPNTTAYSAYTHISLASTLVGGADLYFVSTPATWVVSLYYPSAGLTFS